MWTLLGDTTLNIESFMGIIVMVGIVVSNSILLVDFANQRVSSGEPLRAAVVGAARTRMRPILMTALATLAGLAPIAMVLEAGSRPRLRWRGQQSAVWRYHPSLPWCWCRRYMSFSIRGRREDDAPRRHPDARRDGASLRLRVRASGTRTARAAGADRDGDPSAPAQRDPQDHAARRLAGFFQATLYAKVTGYLRRINVDKGDWIRNGEVLAEIEVPELADRLARENARLKVEKVSYERLQRVWESDRRLVAREDVDIAYGKYQESQSNVNELSTMMKYTRIIAPFDGVVTGSSSTRGADSSQRRRAHFRARWQRGAAQRQHHPGGERGDDEQAAGLCLRAGRGGQPDSARDAGPRLPCAGFPAASSPAAWRASPPRWICLPARCSPRWTWKIRVNELYPGMYANVSIELETHPGALTVPPSAVGAGGDTGEVFVVRNSRLQKLDHTSGIRTGGYVEVTSGLAGDEQVVNNSLPRCTKASRCERS